MVVEIRDWCQNVGEYNTYNFCIWHFGLCIIVSKIERCRSSDPPYEIAINPWWRGGRGLPSLIALFTIVFSHLNDLTMSAGVVSVDWVTNLNLPSNAQISTGHYIPGDGASVQESMDLQAGSGCDDSQQLVLYCG